MAQPRKIDLARFDATLHIAKNMREWDAREIYAQRANNPVELALDAISTTVALNIFLGDEPVANLGGQQVEPGRWQVHMFATPSFRKCSLFTTRYVLRQLLPTAAKNGAWSAFCWSMDGHDEAHAWLKALGAKIVGDAALGRAGEKFLLFEWPTNVFTHCKG